MGGQAYWVTGILMTGVDVFCAGAYCGGSISGRWSCYGDGHIEGEGAGILGGAGILMADILWEGAYLGSWHIQGMAYCAAGIVICMSY